MRSKEDVVLELFFNNPKQWHFDKIKEISGLSRSRLSMWLKKFQKQGLIIRIKKKGKMPYYIGNYKKPLFQQKKRIFALKKLTDSGLLTHLTKLRDAKVVVIFGSIIRSDWYDNSDVDIFILGNDIEFNQGKYELRLKRDIQVHKANNLIELNKMKGLLPFIISGDFIKGSIQDLGVEVYAKV